MTILGDQVLKQIKTFYRGEHVVLVGGGPSAHRSRAMRVWVAEQDWLTHDDPLTLPS
ncbi:hypothetical protein [Streptomyces sp. WAC 04229]|uniref:hypothetical protein n=1 Tax=Streptomyces sp. WAC 04229 TaxID=2203206 RepID=UPI00163B94DE|nr:hypothetical protein [Streptomyces sp. WAC 04229]